MKAPHKRHDVALQWRTIQYSRHDSEQRLGVRCTCGFEDDVDSDIAAFASVTEHKLDVLLAAAKIEFTVEMKEPYVEEE